MSPSVCVLVLWSATSIACPTGPGRAEIRAELVRPAGSMRDAYGSVSASDGRRSIPLAFVLSAAVPGAGQVYNRQWIKAAAAVSLEALAVTAWAIKRRDGLDAQDAVEAFAHRGWDPTRYAAWLTDYVEFLETTDGASVTAPLPDIPSGIDFSAPDSWSESERSTVDAFFDEIRAVERQVYHPETHATFSHQLPYFGEQQYYELIGKYFQFAPGWDDYPAWRDASGAFTVAIDPEHTGAGGSKPNVSDTFFEYAHEHAHAQDILRTAERISGLVIVNHLLAAVDAAVFAKLHNDRLSTSFGMAYDPAGAPQPVAVVRLRF